MTCDIVRVRGGVFSLWGTPELPDVALVLREAAQAREESGGPILYVTRVPEAAPAPERDVRREIDRSLPKLIKSCTSYHVVLEGDGFVAAFKRGVLTSMLQPFWRKRTFFVHANCLAVLGSLSPAEIPVYEELLRVAGARGLLHGQPPSLRTSAK